MTPSIGTSSHPMTWWPSNYTSPSGCQEGFVTTTREIARDGPGPPRAASYRGERAPAGGGSEPRHEPQHRILGRLASRQLARQPPAAEHDDPVREADHLRQLARDDEDRRPARRELADRARGSPPSRPRRRRAWARRESGICELAASHLASTIFCWLPPESPATHRVEARRADAQPVEVLARHAPLARTADPAQPRQPTEDRRATCCAVRSRRAPAPAACGPPARSRCRARSRAPGCAPRTGVPRSTIRPRVGRSIPNSADATSDRPAPISPASPTISPARSENETSSNLPGTVSPSTRSTSSPAPVVLCRPEVLGERTPDHHLHEIAPR